MSQITWDFAENHIIVPHMDKDLYEIKFSTKENTIEK